MNANRIQRTSKFEVQSFDGGYAVFLATYEYHPRTGRTENILNRKVTKVYGHEMAAQRHLERIQDSEVFKNFRNRQ